MVKSIALVPKVFVNGISTQSLGLSNGITSRSIVLFPPVTARRNSLPFDLMTMFLTVRSPKLSTRRTLPFGVTFISTALSIAERLVRSVARKDLYKETAEIPSATNDIELFASQSVTVMKPVYLVPTDILEVEEEK